MNSQYLDDLLNIDNSQHGQPYFTSELQFNKANVSDTKASFLDLYLSILDGFVKTKMYDKRADFDIVNLHF